MTSEADLHTYVVRLLTADEPATLKHFTAKREALSYAQQHMRSEEAEGAAVFRVSTTNTREAVMAVRDGRAELVDRLS